MKHYFAVAFIALLLSACSASVRFSGNSSSSSSSQSSKEISTQGEKLPQGFTFRGQASYYADKFQGRPTASGEIFDQTKLTAAHRTIAFGTKLKITNLKNRRQTIVIINDRGPFVGDRIIDLSRAAAENLDMVRDGIADVECEVIE